MTSTKGRMPDDPLGGVTELVKLFAKYSTEEPLASIRKVVPAWGSMLREISTVKSLDEVRPEWQAMLFEAKKNSENTERLKDKK